MDSLILLPKSGTASNDPRNIDRQVKAEEKGGAEMHKS